MRIDNPQINTTLGIGRAATCELDVFGSINGNVVAKLGNASMGAVSQSIFQILAGTSYVNVTLNFTSSYYQEVANNITTRYSDFNVHSFRTASGAERLGIDAAGKVTIAQNLVVTGGISGGTF